MEGRNLCNHALNIFRLLKPIPHLTIHNIKINMVAPINKNANRCFFIISNIHLDDFCVMLIHNINNRPHNLYAFVEGRNFWSCLDAQVQTNLTVPRQIEKEMLHQHVSEDCVAASTRKVGIGFVLIVNLSSFLLYYLTNHADVLCATLLQRLLDSPKVWRHVHLNYSLINTLCKTAFKKVKFTI